MAKMCNSCGTVVDDNFQNCPNCGAVVVAQQTATPNMQQPSYQQQSYQQPAYQQAGLYPEQKSKMAAGLLGIFLGAWGIHNFYLGNTGRGVAQIIVSIVTCGIGSIWGLIEGIMILTGSIKTDANGIPLKD